MVFNCHDAVKTIIMEFLFQFMSEIFALEEETDDLQMISHAQGYELENIEDVNFSEEDLVTQNIFSLGEFH